MACPVYHMFSIDRELVLVAQSHLILTIWQARQIVA